MKYFCKKGMSLKEIHDSFIKTHGDESPSYSMMKKWAAQFRRGRENMEDYEWFAHPEEAAMDKNVQLMCSLIMCGRRKGLHDIGRQIGISFGTVQSTAISLGCPRSQLDGSPEC